MSLFLVQSLVKGRGASHKQRANHRLAVWIYARVFRLVRLSCSWQKAAFLKKKNNKESAETRCPIHRLAFSATA